MPHRKQQTPEQIRRETGRLYAAKGAAMRDIKALAALAKPPKRRRATATKPAEAPQGIRMGS